MKKLFLIIGAPGSGKTTDAEIIAERNGSVIKHYSAGEMFRAEVASGSERGRLIDSFISKGNIVPIDIAVETIVGAIKKAPRNIVIIDGYPRSIEQMRELDRYLSNEAEVELLKVIEVVELLRKAQRQIDDDHLTTPPGDNALDSYRAVLTKAPGNGEALAGIDRIAAIYVQWAKIAEGKGSATRARRYIEKALLAKPDDPALLAELRRLEGLT